MTGPNLAECLKVLPTDYADYGGEIKRWEDDRLAYPDCSSGCRFFVKLEGPFSSDWGVCAKPRAPRSGMLTWEHQAGFGCFEGEEDEE
jgi:hypothetical protein